MFLAREQRAIKKPQHRADGVDDLYLLPCEETVAREMAACSHV